MYKDPLTSFFSTAVYSDRTDTSSYPESDYSFSSHSSVISDFGEAPLSSTRRSSFFNLSNMNGRPSSRGIPYNRRFDVDTKRHLHQDWNDSFAHWAFECPSVLSSTRMSAVGPAVAMPILKEDGLFIPNNDIATTEGIISLSKRDTLPAFPSNRKSVSFRDADEYFPVFSPESPKQQPAAHGSQCTSSLPFNLSDYSDFLDSEGMATVLQKHGIDVTSPDHVYVFCRESSTSTEEDMEKTVNVIGRCALDESGDEQEREHVKESQVNIPEEPAASCGRSSSSETTSSHYSSCESDHYASALEASTHPKHVFPPAANQVSVGAGSTKNMQISPDSDARFSRQDGNTPPLRTEPLINTECETTEVLPSMLDKLVLSGGQDDFDACGGRDVDARSEDCVGKLVADTRIDDTGDALTEDMDLPFKPSPFVTGRTRSRLSRCSLRTSRTPESLLFASSLFEETLPTAVRSRRQTPRSQSSEDYYSSPHAPHYRPSSSESSTGGGLWIGDYLNTQSSDLGADSSVSNSQADTLILSKSGTTAGSQTISDTVILEKSYNAAVDAYERNLAEVILALQGQGEGHAEGRDFLTDDPTSTDDTSEKGNVRDASGVRTGSGDKNDDSWISADCNSQPDSVSSSSSTSFSPRTSRDDSDQPCTPGTGCTPRYSMSRLSSCRRPQHLANLSYTPGGRPLIQDLDEPVEYLYTDTEQGHKLIETHVPPTANTSLSSTVSTSSSEETILYDWRSMHTDMMSKRGKENQKPQMLLQNKQQQQQKADDEDAGRVLPEIKGMTDKELRLRLIELGENPGPINSRTRATYMRRLCRRLQESDSHKSPHHHKHLDQPHTGNARALFKAYYCSPNMGHS